MSPLFSVPPEIRFEIFTWVHTGTELTENPQEHLLTCGQHYVENRLLTFALNWQEGYLHPLPELDNFVARLVPGQMEAIQYLTLSFDCETGLAPGIEVEKLALLTGLRHLHVKILAWFCQCPELSKDDHHLEAAVKVVDERILAKSYPKNEDKGSGRSNYKLIGGGIVTFHLCDSHDAFLSEQSTLS
ncbi:hypothetical protein BU24DRAFT_464210 [Aaosphaeria arxii CBS 175.79]|uniref:Uncharacterized protein n=1 Tax=Aaosphaeria arxii CBS 175.79 TaxID=1450172 RepID=A0A6A5XKU1_9PLEO|nr:uncharacterized protein BU24DRAFT_464210 [Aaosphaeria arxii CBS 175.79]KAF2013427.1 hypothetical protein BU24DRAFT_464210 [Aaosphaeria arxii CBS 175.79]